MKDHIRALLANLKLGNDGIWSSDLPAGMQQAEQKMREQIAAQPHDDYMADISKHHSVPVMDQEICRFLGSMPNNAVILDVGGCWGWHWRKIRKQRSDVNIIIVDFVRNNLVHARNVLGSLVGEEVILVHANATALPFSDGTFDGFWTVQTFQHIPDFHLACCEAYRVLNNGGVFINYSLHITPFIRLISRMVGRPYHIKGNIPGLFYLERANDGQRQVLSDVFSSKVVDRYAECLFHPNLKITFSGKENNVFGRLDAMVSGDSIIARWVARQRGFSVVKNSLAGCKLR